MHVALPFTHCCSVKTVCSQESAISTERDALAKNTSTLTSKPLTKMAQISNRLNQSITIVRLPVLLSIAGSVRLVVGFAVAGRVLVIGLDVFPFKSIISLPSSTFDTPFGATLPWADLTRTQARQVLEDEDRAVMRPLRRRQVCEHRRDEWCELTGQVGVRCMSDVLYSALPQESSGFLTLLIASAPGQMALLDPNRSLPDPSRSLPSKSMYIGEIANLEQI
jgi:hypothetical protein